MFDGEDRILVPSPKVATYDHKPEMSALEVMAKLEDAIASGKYDLIAVNFANPDMVGHTGIMSAAIAAVDTIDVCLGRLRAAVEKAGGVLLVTADHGNIELMKDQATHQPHTAHTTLDVPIIAVNARPRHQARRWAPRRRGADPARSHGPAQDAADDGPFAGRSGQCGERRLTKPRPLLLAGVAILGALFLTAAKKPEHRRPHGKPAHTHAAPPVVPPSVEALPDLGHAMPAQDAAHLPSTADQFKRLKGDLARGKPVVDSAKARSATLKAQAAALRRKLVTTAERIQMLERQKIVLDAEIARLAKEDARLSAGFARDRIQVARLLAVIERLQHDTPPALAMRPDDALSAARGAMLVGASLPDVYGKAAALARRITTLQHTRAALIARRTEASRNAAQLAHARVELHQLLAIKDAAAIVAECDLWRAAPAPRRHRRASRQSRSAAGQGRPIAGPTGAAKRRGGHGAECR